MPEITAEEGRRHVRTLFNYLEMVPQPKQIEFITRAMNGSVQGRFSRQMGATLTLSVAAALFAGEGNRVHFIAHKRMHAIIAMRLLELFDRAGIVVADMIQEEMEDEDGNKHQIEHSIKLNLGEVFLRHRWRLMDADYTLFDAPHALAFPGVLKSDTVVLELGSGWGTRWDSDPILMPWHEAPIAHEEAVRRWEREMDPEAFARDFLAGFDGEEHLTDKEQEMLQIARTTADMGEIGMFCPVKVCPSCGWERFAVLEASDKEEWKQKGAQHRFEDDKLICNVNPPREGDE